MTRCCPYVVFVPLCCFMKHQVLEKRFVCNVYRASSTCLEMTNKAHLTWPDYHPDRALTDQNDKSLHFHHLPFFFVNKKYIKQRNMQIGEKSTDQRVRYWTGNWHSIISLMTDKSLESFQQRGPVFLHHVGLSLETWRRNTPPSLTQGPELCFCVSLHKQSSSIGAGRVFCR